MNIFILNETRDQRNIGIIKAENNEQLNKKCMVLIQMEYDNDLVDVPDLDTEQIRNTHSGSFTFTAVVDDESKAMELIPSFIL